MLSENWIGKEDERLFVYYKLIHYLRHYNNPILDEMDLALGVT